MEEGCGLLYSVCGGIFVILSLILRKSLTGIVVLVRKSASWSLVRTYSMLAILLLCNSLMKW